ncbi:MAG TPA: Gfo/Idh/MocA family oxidoreductase [Acidimicrobiales bacterium]|nr:Gfo/Idh/MocA family oxidoreductase [Acidimicrobiales bacterium]
MLTVGFVGTGVIAWAHAIGLQAMISAGVVDARIAVVHDLDGERASGFAAANGAVAVASAAEVVERCDAVWVCTPTAAHVAAVQTAVVAGRAVFCEKPLSTDLAGAEALAETVRAGGVPAQVGLVLRSTPVFRALRDVVASGELGPPMTAVFRDDQYFPVQGLYGSTWRGDVAVAGGGCLIEHSIHDLDILRFCLGEVAELSARTANFAGYEGVEDLATVSLHFESGASAELVSVWHDILSRGSTRRVEVFCRRGTAWLEDDHLGPLHVQTADGVEVRTCRPPDWVESLPIGRDDMGLVVRMYCEADRAFVDAVAAGRPPDPGLDEAVVAHGLVDAAYRSAAAGGVPVVPGSAPA